MADIYLDYNASTPIDSRVMDVMRRLLNEPFGNPSSGHWAGAPAKAILESARGQVAALLGVRSDEVVFTSGGSEANNLAIKGTFLPCEAGAIMSSHKEQSIRRCSSLCASSNGREQR